VASSKPSDVAANPTHFDIPPSPLPSQEPDIPGFVHTRSPTLQDPHDFDLLQPAHRLLGQPQYLPFDSWSDLPSLDFAYDFQDEVPTPAQLEITTPPANSRKIKRDEHFVRIQRLWPLTEQNTRPARSMWRDVAQAKRSAEVSDHVQDSSPSVVADSVSQAFPEYSFDEASYQRLFRAFGPLLAQQTAEAIDDSGPHNSRQDPLHSVDQFRLDSAEQYHIRFPSREVLDVSVGLYFRRFHPLFPFLHEPTFKAQDTQTSLLFSLCLIGLCYLGDDSAKRFVHHVAPVSQRQCGSYIRSR
jgi:hypothetical protein